MTELAKNSLALNIESLWDVWVYGATNTCRLPMSHNDETIAL